MQLPFIFARPLFFKKFCNIVANRKADFGRCYFELSPRFRVYSYCHELFHDIMYIMLYDFCANFPNKKMPRTLAGLVVVICLSANAGYAYSRYMGACLRQCASICRCGTGV